MCFLAELKINYQNWSIFLDVLYKVLGFSLVVVWFLFNMTAVKETTWLKRMACTDQRDLTVWRGTRHGVSPTFNHSTKPSLCCLSLSQSPAKALLLSWTVWRFEDCLNQTVGLLLTVTTKQVRQKKLRPDFKKTLKIQNVFPGPHAPETNLESWVTSNANILIVCCLNTFLFLNGAALNSRRVVTHRLDKLFSKFNLLSLDVTKGDN